MSLDFFKDKIVEAAARRMPLRLRGGGTKDFYGNEPRGEVLDTRDYAGVVDYEPTELVITARCGTRLIEIQNLLEKQNQMLAFEPPLFGDGATLGGCVAAASPGRGARRPARCATMCSARKSSTGAAACSA